MKDIVKPREIPIELKTLLAIVLWRLLNTVLLQSLRIQRCECSKTCKCREGLGPCKANCKCGTPPPLHLIRPCVNVGMLVPVHTTSVSVEMLVNVCRLLETM